MSQIPLILLLLALPSISPNLLFVLKDNVPTCYIEELFMNSVLIIKYKMFTKSHSDLSMLVPYIRMTITGEDDKKQYNSFGISEVKGKNSFLAPKEGMYRVCVYRSRYRGNNAPKEDVYMNIKFASDNMDEVNLSNAIKTDDLNNLQKKAKQIIAMTEPIIRNQESNLYNENKSSVETLENSKWYKYMTFGQVIITFIIGLVQLNNFRKFLKMQNVIS